MVEPKELILRAYCKRVEKVCNRRKILVHGIASRSRAVETDAGAVGVMVVGGIPVGVAKMSTAAALFMYRSVYNRSTAMTKDSTILS